MRRDQAANAPIGITWMPSRRGSLTKTVAPELRDAYGVGLECAAVWLVSAGDNPERIRSEASFAVLCGASPLPASSGNTTRHRLNRGGNRRASCGASEHWGQQGGSEARPYFRSPIT
jgi:hypothetical protein